MKTTFLSCGLSLLLAVISSRAAENITKSEKQSFFQDTPKERLFSVLPNIDPKSEMSLAVNQNSNVVTVFTWWLNRVLEPSYVPSTEFITQNVQLYPANKQHSEDIAALSFEIGDDHYQVIQTGGLNSRVYVLVESGKSTDMDADHAKRNVEGMINAMLWGKPAKKSATVTLVSTNGAYVGEGTFDDVPVKCLTNGKEMCISFPKWPFEETVAAHVTMPNEWFSWERGKERSQNMKIPAIAFKFKTMVVLPNGEYVFVIQFDDHPESYSIKVGEEFQGFKILKHETLPNPENDSKVPLIHKLTINFKDRMFSIVQGKEPIPEEENKNTQAPVGDTGRPSP